MSDDLQEFMDKANKQRSSPPSNYGEVEPPSPRAIRKTSVDEDAKPGRLVQWSLFGPGYMPTTKTVQRLEPDVYHIDTTPHGAIFTPHKLTTDDLLRLPDSKSDAVIKEIEEFWPLKERFKRFGYTHKRGFLLWGPPGSGKTCTVAVVGKQMVAKGGIVILCNVAPGLLGAMLLALREIEPDRQVVVVMEDIDTIINRFGESETLAILDGENSIDNVVYMATTNYPENLDGRIVNRPSRFDRVVKIGMPSPEARMMYLRSRKLELDDKQYAEWVEKTEGFSIAHLKELIIGMFCFNGTLDDEVKRLKAMAVQPKSSGGNSAGFQKDRD